MIQYIRNMMGPKDKSDLENTQREVAQMSVPASIAFVTMAESGSIDEVTASEHTEMFSPWANGMAYAVGNLRTYGEGDDRKLYKCIQAHTAQADWTPDVAVSLWAVAGDPTVEFPDWSQPIGAQDAYQTGDKVTYEDKHWISTVNDNVWAPGVYGWDEVE